MVDTYISTNDIVDYADLLVKKDTGYQKRSHHEVQVAKDPEYPMACGSSDCASSNQERIRKRLDRAIRNTTDRATNPRSPSGHGQIRGTTRRQQNNKGRKANWDQNIHPLRQNPEILLLASARTDMDRGRISPHFTTFTKDGKRKRQ